MRRDFERQLKEMLDANLVVNTCKMVKFVGRDKVIENMISRGELEEANYSDIERQEQTEAVRKKQASTEKNRQERLEEEEAKLRELLG